ncbi:MAG: bifunctional riboflavin kinase/FAD synthetase [Nitrospira sp.]|jgi:riboflavin kinase/FMN adenylyltransferase|nr:bifunctional riboflavin kinase/FAD synthetase [Nitrospira sp.]MDI3462365.1 FMN adenylyltransferase / Riboflavin kinase [Nitrospira sp.]
MKVTRGYSDEVVRPYPVGTIGNFDGHHLGHRALLKQVVETARRAQGTAVVLTFDPHPVKILAPHVDLQFLTSGDEKRARFEKTGIDEVISLEFTHAFASLSPEMFAEQVLSKGLGLKEIFVGQHFAFGHKRAGQIDDLTRFGEKLGFIVHSLPPVMIDGGVVSSTRIRQLIIAGHVDQAAVLLGRHYALSGIVYSGEGRGRTLGCPTANLKLPPDRVVPADGIYAAVAILDQKRHDSVAYIGARPTFDGSERGLEVSILDGIYELYGRTLTVEFIGRVRGDARFDSGEALSRQITADVGSAKLLLRRYHETIGER